MAKKTAKKSARDKQQEWENNRAKHKFQHVYHDTDTNSVYIYFNGFADSHERPVEIHGEFVVILPAKEYKRMRDYFLAHEEAPLLWHRSIRMKVYVPIIAVIGYMEFDVEGEERLPQAIQSIKDMKPEPTNLVIESYKPNYDAARATPEVERQYDGS